MDKRKIYSLNLLAYIYFSTGMKPQLKKDELTGAFYGVYPICKEVGEAIKQFRTPDIKVELHQFLNAFQDIRDDINYLRGQSR